MEVTVVGMGYVGLTLAVHMANKGVRVLGIESNLSVLKEISALNAHFFEEGFNDELKKAFEKGNLRFSNVLPARTAPTTFVITVGTPLERPGQNSNNLEIATNQISSNLVDGDHIILRSTVKVGTTSSVVQELLRKSNKQFFLSFCPERTLEGNALRELETLPQIVAGIDAESLAKSQKFFEDIGTETVPVKRVEEAELAKLMNNAERDLSFALANELANMCDSLGLSTRNVLQAAGYKYPRSNLKRPGLVGGPCLEKDPHILNASLDHTSYQPLLFKAARIINEDLSFTGFKKLINQLRIQNKNGITKIAVLGFSFKGNPETSDTRGSLVFTVIKHLRDAFPESQIFGHDFLAAKDDIEATGARYVAELQDLDRDVNLIILQNNHSKYRDFEWKNVISAEQPTYIYDFWNQVKSTELPPSVTYVAFGEPYGK